MSKRASYIILSSLFVRPIALHVRSNLVTGLTYERLIGKNYLQACFKIVISSKIKNINQVINFHATAIESATKSAVMNDCSVTKTDLIGVVYRSISLIHCRTDYKELAHLDSNVYPSYTYLKIYNPCPASCHVITRCKGNCLSFIACYNMM